MERITRVKLQWNGTKMLVFQKCGDAHGWVWALSPWLGVGHGVRREHSRKGVRLGVEFGVGTFARAWGQAWGLLWGGIWR